MDISVTEHADTPHGACDLVNHRFYKLNGLSWVCRGCPEINCSNRERLRLGENKAAIASQVRAATIEIGLTKANESVGGSRTFARYVPFWA